VSRIFAAPATADRLLPLFALFASVEQVCTEYTDEDVARRKLNWWREECLVRGIASSEHPALRELQSTGGADQLELSDLGHLFAGAAYRLDAPAPVDCSELESLCLRISQPQIELEKRVCGADGDSQLLAAGDAARNGLLQLLREHRSWWLPLNLLARHGLSRASLSDPSQAESVSKLFRELLAAADEWGGKPAAPSTTDPQLRHLFVLSSLNSRKLRALQKRQPPAYDAELGRLRPSDVFAAWKLARNFYRQI
jgi:phytoene synthase